MTVIMGVNLSDRICLVADSRVSYIDKFTGKTNFKHDDMLKIEPLNSLKGCVIASAGDGGFAAILIRNLNRDFKDYTITQLRAEIYDWAIKQGEAYSLVNNQSMVTFLVAGVDESNKKVINRERMNSVLEAHFDGKSGMGKMRPFLMDAITKADPSSAELILDANDTRLFSIRIDLQSGVDIQDSEWGDVLIYGPTKVENEQISSKAVGRFEFDQTKGDLESLLAHDSTMLVAIINSFMTKKSWLTVGGALIPMHLYSNMKLATLPRKFLSSELNGNDLKFVSGFQVEPGGKFYRMDDNDTKHRMYQVSDIKVKQRKNKKSKTQGDTTLYIEL